MLLKMIVSLVSVRVSILKSLAKTQDTDFVLTNPIGRKRMQRNLTEQIKNMMMGRVRRKPERKRRGKVPYFTAIEFILLYIVGRAKDLFQLPQTCEAGV